MSHPPKLSYWEIRDYLDNNDLVVVGSGIVGLSTAIIYKQRFPYRKVLILERGMLPSGASTKNAGFACFGSPSEILADLKSLDEEKVFALIEKRYGGLQALRSLIGNEGLNYQACGGYEIFGESDGQVFDRCKDFLPSLNNELKQRLGLIDTYSVCNERILGFGFSKVSNMIVNQFEGSIDTGKMMQQLLMIALQSGVRILNNMEVQEFSEKDDSVQICVRGGFEISSRKLHIATNGFAAQLLPGLDVQPARAQVLVTSEISNLKLRGTFHMNEGFYYFRNIDGRILLGGGRELDKAGETSTEMETTEMIQNRLEELLRDVILSGQSFQIDHRWSGIMGVGQTKEAIVKQISNRISCAVRLGGMGIAIGASIGKEGAELIG